jgi:YD repeat-containing protein
MRLRVICLVLIALSSTAVYGGDPASNRGIDLAGVYQVNDIDNINLFSGNLIIDVPLATQFPLNGGFSYGIHLVYTGQPWDFPLSTRLIQVSSTTEDPIYENVTKATPVPNRRSNAGMAWRVTMGQLLLGSGAFTPPCNTGQTCVYYESPDGAQHELSTSSITANNITTSYSADGSYLRLKQYLNLGYEELEFPDGTIHRFDSTGRLIGIYTPFDRVASSAASVTVEYLSNPQPVNQCQDSVATSCWKIYDNLGRTQYVTFASTQNLYTHQLAHKIIAPAPAGGTVAYTLNYNDQTTLDAANDTVLHLDDCYTRWRDTNDPNSYAVPLLTSIDLPDGSKYNIHAHNDATNGYCFQGSLETLTLPTRGNVSYTYIDWTLGHQRDYDPPYLPGVSHRTKTPAGGTPQTWNYDPAPDSHYQGPGCPTSVDCVQEYRARKVTVTDPDNRRTRHYFSNVPTPATSEQIAGGGWTPAEVGLPFTRDTTKTMSHPRTGDTYYLSSEVLDAAGNVDRSNYVQYEYVYAEAPLNSVYGHEYPANFRRENASLTIYAHDVASYDPQNNDAPVLRWSSTVRSDFDQFGHYRRTVTDGNFAAESSTQDKRTEYVNYNPSNPTWAPGSAPSWSTADPWILGTFNYQWNKVPSNPNDPPGTISHTKKAEFCFEASTGFLSRRRLLWKEATSPTADITAADEVAQDNADVITEFGRLTHNSSLDATGNVLSEKTYGGDTPYGVDPVTILSGSLCGLQVPAARYQLWHTYQNGVRATSEYYDSSGSPMGFKILDRTIEATAAVSKERDTAGVETTYVFDPDDLLRVKTVQRPGMTDVSYAYAPPSSTTSSFTPAQITVTQGDTTSRVQYDSFGRIWREFRTMPVGEVTRETLYDASNRKISQSLWALGSYANKTSYHYDFLGRLDSVDPPDHQVVTTSYIGDSQRTTTAAVMTSTNSAAAQTPTTTTEQMDRYGRLWYVREPDGVKPDGTPDVRVTAYGYGVSGALTRVCMGASLLNGTLSTTSCGQQRLFTYDNRGFLISETHPENGTINYSYDANGHLLTKRPQAIGPQGVREQGFDLNYKYDDAERLLQIDSWYPSTSLFRPSKVFTFAVANDGTNLRQGKLETAVRHNYHPAVGDVRITETYAYKDAAGRLTDRTTDIRNATYGSINQRIVQQQTYDLLGLPDSITYPYCDTPGIPCGAPSSNYGYFNHTNGVLTEVGTAFAGFSDYAALTYHPNGMLNNVNHSNAVHDTYSYDTATGLSRPKSISFGDFGSCTAPTLTALPSPVYIASGGQATLTANASGSGTLKYYWRKDYNSQVIGFSPTLTTGTLTAEQGYNVQVVNSCGTVQGGVLVKIAAAPAISVHPQSVTLSGPSSAHLTVSASGTSLTYQWFQGTSGSGTAVGSNQPFYDTPVLNTTTSYWVRVSNVGGSVNSNTATVTVPPQSLLKPNAFSATMLTTASVQLSWTAVTGAQHYEIWRREYAGALHKVGESTAAGYTDAPVNSNTAYVYQVCASPGSTTACTSPFSDQDLATTVAFTSLTQDPVIRLAHFNELLAAINVVRAANPGSAGTAVTWAQIIQGSPAPPAPALNGIVYGEHMLALRRTLDSALQTLLGITPASYIDPNLPGSPRIFIKAIHVTELRSRMQ